MFVEIAGQIYTRKIVWSLVALHHVVLAVQVVHAGHAVGKTQGDLSFPRRPAAEVVLGTGLQIRSTREGWTVRFCQVAAKFYTRRYELIFLGM